MQTLSATQRPHRKDDLLGICAAIGADFGFNPDMLRVLLTAGLLWNPAIILGGYAFAGLVMLLNRRLFPRVPLATATAPLALPAHALPTHRAEIEALPLAA